MIRKKQTKKGTLPASQPVSENEGDPFEELNRYLRQPRLRREDCPNPIPWWGVSNIIIVIIIFKILKFVPDKF
jgi:hypothetical protein